MSGVTEQAVLIPCPRSRLCNPRFLIIWLSTVSVFSWCWRQVSLLTRGSAVPFEQLGWPWGNCPVSECHSWFCDVIITWSNKLNTACELCMGLPPERRNNTCIAKLLSDCPMAIRASLCFITKQHVYPICKIICECPKVFCSVFNSVVFWLRGYSVLSAKEIRLS